MKRALAAVVAVVLIVGAFLIRRDVIDNDDDDPVAASSTTAPAPAASSLLCATELADACAALASADPELAVTVEDAGTSVDRLAALDDDAEVPLWLTVAPFPGMVDALRQGAGRAPLYGETDPLAASQLAVALPANGRADALTSFCAATPLWRCIGEQAGRPWTDLGGPATWGTVRPSLGKVETSATALASFADAVAGYLGSGQVSRSAWEADPSFIPWLGRLAGAVEPSALSSGDPLATMLTRPSALDVAASSAHEIATLGATGDRFDVQYPDPSMWLQAVLATPGGTAVADDLGSEATAALQAAGWDAAAQATQPLPNASTMLALRSLWQEAA